MNTSNFNNRLEKLLSSSFFFNLGGTKSLKSLKAFSYIIAFFALMFVAAYIYKWSVIPNGQTTWFKLVFNDINILPLYTQYKFVFTMVSILDILKLFAIALVFFIVDTISILYLHFFEEALGLNRSLRLFHFEYLFIVYFLFVFANIFKRGVDLNNEIDLVI